MITGPTETQLNQGCKVPQAYKLAPLSIFMEVFEATINHLKFRNAIYRSRKRKRFSTNGVQLCVVKTKLKRQQTQKLRIIKNNLRMIIEETLITKLKSKPMQNQHRKDYRSNKKGRISNFSKKETISGTSLKKRECLSYEKVSRQKQLKVQLRVNVSKLMLA